LRAKTAVGDYSDGTATLTLTARRNGTGWKQVASANPAGTSRYDSNILNAVAAASAVNVWAVDSWAGMAGQERSPSTAADGTVLPGGSRHLSAPTAVAKGGPHTAGSGRSPSENAATSAGRARTGGPPGRAHLGA
jgi:hypothetical protein